MRATTQVMAPDALRQRRRIMVLVAGLATVLMTVWAIVGMASKYRDWLNVSTRA